MGRPKVVALGGGHGLAMTLSAVARYAGQVTAVVSAADDGGSSGRLRQWWQGPAPGDVRRCLLALAGAGPKESLWARALDYRFPSGELAGHSLGNLVLVGLTEAGGDFVESAARVAELLGVPAQVLPATSEAVALCAQTEGEGPGHEIEGQANVAHSLVRVKRVWLRPADPPAPPEVISAIEQADQVVLGPGSLFTSVLAVCSVPQVRVALARRSGGRVYVCNLAPQDGETAGYDARDHIEALQAHGVVVDAVLCDPDSAVGAPGSVEGEAGPGRAGQGDAPQRSGARAAPRVVQAALAGPNGRSHSPELLAAALGALAALGAPAAPAGLSGGSSGPFA